MDIIVALVGLALVVIVAAYVAQPLIVKTHIKTSAEESLRDKLLAERDSLYAAIRDLDFDFQTGKLVELDYRAMREKYMARGVEILKQLDAMTERWPQDAGHRAQIAVTDEIEAAVQARRKARQAAQAPEDEVEAMIRARRQIRNPKPPKEGDSEIRNQVCPSCGHPFDPTDRFCARCGAALTTEATR